MLVGQGKGTTYPELGVHTGLAPSAVHSALKRAAAAGLVLFSRPATSRAEAPITRIRFVWCQIRVPGRTWTVDPGSSDGIRRATIEQHHCTLRRSGPGVASQERNRPWTEFGAVVSNGTGSRSSRRKSVCRSRSVRCRALRAGARAQRRPDKAGRVFPVTQDPNLSKIELMPARSVRSAISSCLHKKRGVRGG